MSTRLPCRKGADRRKHRLAAKRAEHRRNPLPEHFLNCRCRMGFATASQMTTCCQFGTDLAIGEPFGV